MAIQFAAPPRESSITPITQSLNEIFERYGAKKELQGELEKQRAKTAGGLKSLLKNLSDEEAQQLAGLPPQTLNVALKELLAAPQREADAALLQQLFGIPAQQQQLLGPLQGMEQQQGGIPPLGTPVAAGSRLGTKQILDIYTQQQQLKLAQERAQREEKKFQHEEQKAGRDYLAPYIATSDASNANIRIYKDIIDLTKKGGLNIGRTYELLNKVGLWDVSKGLNDEIYEKLAGQLAINVGKAFGTNVRLTNFIESVFQRTLPNMRNSPQGAYDLSNFNLYLNEINNALTEAAIQKTEQWFAAGKGIPFDADAQVRKAAKPRIAGLEKKMENLVRTIDKRNKQGYYKQKRGIIELDEDPTEFLPNLPKRDQVPEGYVIFDNDTNSIINRDEL